MKRHLLSIILLILLVSCKQKAQKVESNEVEPATEIKAEPKKQIDERIISEQYFENDSLVSVLESELEKIALNPKFIFISEPTSNSHDKSVIDTIKTLTFDKTKIYSYLATNWESIFSAKIENSDFEFLDSIIIGTKKENLEHQIKTEIKTNKLNIRNLEQTSFFIFKFENEKLKVIEYEGYVD